MAPLRGARGLSYRAYQELPAPARALPERVLRVVAERELRRQPWYPGERDHRWLIGPLNTAGQAQAWAEAARQQSDVEALSLSAERVATGASALAYATDVHLSGRVQARGMGAHRARVLGSGDAPGVTGVLSETGRAVLDDVFRRTILDDLPALDAVGARAALVVHGSELRDLHEHAERDPVSPFRGAWDEHWHQLQALVDRTREVVDAFPGPVLVTTLDMLETVPGSTLLPVAVRVDDFAGAPAALERPVPVVLHAPTNPRLKATDVIDPLLQRLHEQGRVDYRRLEGVPHAQMPAAVADADIVVDQLALGNVGVLAVEAMAAGRLVVGHATPAVRSRARELAGVDLPLLEADPTTFGDVIQEVLEDPGSYQHLARAGAAWARELHDGRRSVEVLREVLGR